MPNIFRLVVDQDVNGDSATDTLECGHTVNLARRLNDSGKAVWYDPGDRATTLFIRSRRCWECEAVE